MTAVAALTRLGYPCDTDHLMPYTRLTRPLATHDIDAIEEYETLPEQVEAAVALTCGTSRCR